MRLRLADPADVIGASADARFTSARQELDARMNTGVGEHARWQGYLALIAHALGQKDAFPRLYATYLDQPRRPESLDALLAEAASRKEK